MISFENYMKSLLIVDAFKTYGDTNVRSGIIQETLSNLSNSDPELSKALQLELDRQHMI